MDILFINAELHDKKDWAILKQIVWKETYTGIYPVESIENFDYTLYENKFVKDYQSGEQNLYFIEYLGEKIGYFCFGKSKYKDIGVDYALNSLYIISKYKHKGIGTKVFEFIKNHFKKIGVTEFYNGCNYHNIEAQNFYKKMGGTIFKKDIGHTNKEENQVYFYYKI